MSGNPPPSSAKLALALGAAFIVSTTACGGCGGDGAPPPADDPGSEDAGAISPAEAVCGDGVAADGEGCDDGNRVDGDGCSASCAPETACVSPTDLAELAQTSADGVSTLVADLSEGASSVDHACGAKGAQRAFFFTPSQRGYLTLELSAPHGEVGLSLRTRCAEASAELACVLAAQQATLHVEGGIPLALLISGPSTGSTASLRLRLLPTRGEGEACDPGSRSSACAPGLRCSAAPIPVCVQNTPPVLTGASALRTGRSGKDLYVKVTGTDPDADVTRIGLRAWDAQGRPVLLAGSGAGGAPSQAETTVLTDDSVLGQQAFSTTLTWRGFFALFPLATRLETWFVDSGRLSSASSAMEPAMAPVRGLGEGCDVLEREDVCVTAALCRGGPGLCASSTAPTVRQLAYVRLPPGAGLRGTRLFLDATDPDADLERVTLEWYDAAEQPVPADLDQDGQPETAATAFFETSAGDSPELALNLSTLPSSVVRVAVTLHDHSGLSSSRVLTSLVDQPEVQAGEPCDARWRFDRCPAGHACVGGPPATCAPGAAPSVGRAAYLRIGNGAFVYVEAADPDRDVSLLRFDFQTAEGADLEILDTDSDGQPDSSSYELLVQGLPLDDAGGMFIASDLTELSAFVPRVRLTLRDRAGLSSAPVEVPLTARPLRGAGQACSPRGFDVCVTSSRCEPTTLSEGTCRDEAQLRLDRCASAPLIGPGSFTGELEGPPSWEPPAACVDPALGSGREAVFRLHLDTPAPTLRLTVQPAPGSAVDPVLSLVRACGEDNAASALACQDDVDVERGELGARLELTDVPAGDYLIVVDSIESAPQEGEVELEVSLP